jgi:hypothetical protein
LTLTSSTSSGRLVSLVCSQTQAMEFSLVLEFQFCTAVDQFVTHILPFCITKRTSIYERLNVHLHALTLVLEARKDTFQSSFL